MEFTASQKYIRVLKLRKNLRGIDEIASAMEMTKDEVQAWVNGKVPQGVHPNQAEQWRQAILFGFSAPLEHYRGRGI